MTGKSLGDTVKALNKKYGEKTVIAGRDVEITERVPTGIFPLDLALGGGIPRRKLTIFWGVESSCKTNVCLRTLKTHMELYPDLHCVFVDLEHSFDADWAEQMGVDTTKLTVIQPDFAEEAVDMIQELVQVKNIGMIIVDSLAVMTTQKDFENESGTQRVGGVSGRSTELGQQNPSSRSAGSRRGNDTRTRHCMNSNSN